MREATLSGREIIELIKNLAIKSLYSLWQYPQENKLVILSKHGFQVWECEPLLRFHGQGPGWVESDLFKMLQWDFGRAVHTQPSLLPADLAEAFTEALVKLKLTASFLQVDTVTKPQAGEWPHYSQYAYLHASPSTSFSQEPQTSLDIKSKLRRSYPE